MQDYATTATVVSIHALLAESDDMRSFGGADCSVSIHALLAESDQVRYFLHMDNPVSIHALLAESDILYLLLAGGSC